MSQIETKKPAFHWKTMSDNEFREAQSLLSSPASRRSFLKLMGSSIALAGLAGCGPIRKPKKHIRPYAKQPEHLAPGVAQYYATTQVIGSEVTGLLVESHEGRPTKIEGNPLHPASLGKASAINQASVLDLYDPDRLKIPLFNGSKTSLEDLSQALINSRDAFGQTGEGLAIITENAPSPTLDRLLNQVKRKYRESTIVKYDPINADFEQDGLSTVFNSNVDIDFAFDKAKVILSLGADFLHEYPYSVKYANQFKDTRSENRDFSRLYVLENTFTLTGGKADHRVSMPLSEMEASLWSIANRLLEKIPHSLPNSIVASIKTSSERTAGLLDEKFLDALTDDLSANRGESIIVANKQLSPSLHSLVAILNNALKNHKTVIYRQLYNQPHNFKNIQSLANKIDSGKINTLIILGGNPAYNTPPSLKFKEIISSVSNIFHLSSVYNDTSALSNWVIPRSHFLESWGDALSLEGTYSLVQPLINPMYESVNDIEFILRFLGRKSDVLSNIKRTASSLFKESVSISNKAIRTGIISEDSNKIKPTIVYTKYLSRLKEAIKSYYPLGSNLEVQFKQDPKVYDGRFINNSWLQEVPDPVTKLTWDNAVIISTKLAKKNTLVNGDIIEIRTEKNRIKAPVYILPGQAENSITLSLGYGQTESGKIGKGTGFNAFELQDSDSPYLISNVSISKTGQTYPLASTQEHGSMEGRPLYRSTSLETYKKHPKVIKKIDHHPPLKSLWKEKVYDSGYQWGMTIDLSSCTGCNACVVACQAENNIPVVGKQQVMNGREMHWIRMDRYFDGEGSDASMVQQPVACMHCELAPCEQVCPVAATVHDEEGLNTMVYNRCIGTRYCSNNCPYKVRRFNFFDWNQDNPHSIKKERKHLFDYFKEQPKTVQMQQNPDVTVRMRGVMEKCTYCIQRISEARANAANKNTTIKDGSLVTACQQTCPSSAIQFGNILDTDSEVYEKRQSNRGYSMLSELNTKPRTLYLASLNNPNPALATKKEGSYVDEHH